MILRGERLQEGREIGREDIDAAGVHRAQAFFATDDVQRRAAFRAGFGEGERALGKIERGEELPAPDLGARRPPVQPASDHQMQHQPHAALHADSNPFADAPKLDDGAAFSIRQRGLRGS